MRKGLPDKRGFTVVEIVISLMIVGILAAIAIPAYTKYVDRSNVQLTIKNIRILGLFLVCALLPIGSLAVLSLWEMSGRLKEQTDSRLHQASKNINMGILQGLYALKGELEVLSLSPEGLLRNSSRAPEETIRSSLNQHFLGLPLFREGSIAETLCGTPCPFPPPTDGTRKHLADGNAHLFVRKVPGAPPRIYMAVSSDRRTPGKRILVGQIHPMYLEDIIESVMPAETDLVILDSTGALLYGQKPLSVDVTRRVVDELRRTYSGQFEWGGGDLPRLQQPTDGNQRIQQDRA